MAMAADYTLMFENLLSFYDFTNKMLISIGAGGTLSIAYGRVPRRIVAVDENATALGQLQAAAAEQGLAEKYEFVQGNFLTMHSLTRGDVVLFDFCLHEMANPSLALTRAGELAPEVVVFDHGRNSEWAYHAVEEVKVDRSWTALERFDVIRRRVYTCEQKFKDYAELRSKVEPQGETAIQRIEKFRGRTDITIPMIYDLALVRPAGHLRGSDSTGR
jgi:hypothetical protein